MEMSHCDDLRAFERRLAEVAAGYRPIEKRWRVYFGVFFVCALIAAGFLFCDVSNSRLTCPVYFKEHPIITISICLVLCSLVYFYYEKTFASRIVVARTRDVLYYFGMSCNDEGKIILMRRHPTRTTKTTKKD